MSDALDSSSPKVTVVIPALNEARNLAHVFARMPTDVHEVILVDGNSVDDTVETARRLWPGVRIVRQTRSGKGNALACGCAAATGDVIALVDADGSADPGEIPAFVAALQGGAEFAKGSRYTPGGGSDDITALRSIGNHVLTTIFNLCYRKHYTDLCYGFNVFWRRYAPALGLDLDVAPSDGGRQWGDGFEIETVIHVRVAKEGLAVTEVPSYEHARIHGVSNLNAVSDGLRVLWVIFTERRRSRLIHAANVPGPVQPAPRTFPGLRPASGSHAQIIPRSRRPSSRLIGTLGASTAAAGLVLWGMNLSTSAQPGGVSDGHRRVAVSAHRSPAATPNPGLAAPNATDATIFGDASWRLKFHPLFTGSSLNHSDWATCYPWASRKSGCTNFGHQEYEWYLPGQDHVSNGLLYLVAQRKHTFGVSPTGRRLTYDCRSGMVTTFHSFQFQYGIVQVVAKLPSNLGMWPALWLAASNGKFPPEIDILEHWNRPVRPTGVFLHTVSKPDVYAFPHTANLAVGWHTFTLLWTKQKMVWFIDGRRVLRTYRTVRQSMYFIANLADSRDPSRYGCGGSLIIRSLKIWQR